MRPFEVLSMRRAAVKMLAVAVSVMLAPLPAAATKIVRVVSPSGIEAWLVEDHAIPLVALDFTFAGGANEDPADKPGVAHMVSSLLDEGAGDLDGKAFHERLEDRAVEIAFDAGRDYFHGSVRTLVENRDDAFDLLRLALTAARFEGDAVERIRAQLLTALRRDSTNPGDIASRRWWEVAFPNHPYGRPARGSLESIPRIAVDDLKAFVRRVFARERLKIAVVGDIDAATAGRLVDEVFSGLPAQAELRPVAAAGPQGLGQHIVIDLDVPQAVVVFGGPGIGRRDPDFFAAVLVNHILGGGAMSSRLYTEVREKRGLAYTIHTGLLPLDHAALWIGSTGTRVDKTAETLSIIENEIKRFAEVGPSVDELAKAKSFLEGSYALGFDSSTKIAGQLVQIQQDQLGIDYIDRRNGLIEAVTAADVKRVAQRLLDGPMLYTVVGRPPAVAVKDPRG
ncbi:MAG TPA: pitrilysin family protein [Xanthobacteraceae bacterium]|nr:pitrilysin family protein [Xanthobacteraceae bacterium]